MTVALFHDELFKNLGFLYQSLPGMSCLPGCTACCVSPTMTLLEFIYLFKSQQKKLVTDDFRYMQGLESLIPHKRFEGHYKCPFQATNGFCSVHPTRPMACRLHGLPVLDDLEIADLENCRIMDRDFLPKVEVKEAKNWLSHLLAMNRALFPEYGEGLAQIIGLQWPCWMDIVFGPEMTDQSLLPLRKAARGVLEINQDLLAVATTQIVEKVAYIGLLEMMLSMGDAHTALEMLNDLPKRFVGTGSYWENEAATLKTEILESLSKKTND